MARRSGEPVKHTCPDIDIIISTITSIVKDMDNCDSEDDKEALLEQIKSWSSDLNGIGFGKYCEMEALRSSNSALRNWGSELYTEAENLERERDEFESKYDEAKEKISELESDIEDLQSKIEELETT